jgi:hypothetical protein
MRVAVALILVLGTVSVTTSGRADDAVSVERAKACNDRVAEKNLSDEQLRDYLRACLASEGPLPDPLTTPKDVRRRCDAEANAKNLTGQDRRSFLETCRRG